MSYKGIWGPVGSFDKKLSLFPKQSFNPHLSLIWITWRYKHWHLQYCTNSRSTVLRKLVIDTGRPLKEAACEDRFKHKINTKSTNLLIKICSRKKVYLLERPSTFLTHRALCIPTCIFISSGAKCSTFSSRSSVNGEYVWLAAKWGHTEPTHTHINVSHASVRVATANPRPSLTGWISHDPIKPRCS